MSQRCWKSRESEILSTKFKTEETEGCCLYWSLIHSGSMTTCCSFTGASGSDVIALRPITWPCSSSAESTHKRQGSIEVDVATYKTSYSFIGSVLTSSFPLNELLVEDVISKICHKTLDWVSIHTRWVRFVSVFHFLLSIFPLPRNSCLTPVCYWEWID